MRLGRCTSLHGMRRDVLPAVVSKSSPSVVHHHMLANRTAHTGKNQIEYSNRITAQVSISTRAISFLSRHRHPQLNNSSRRGTYNQLSPARTHPPSFFFHFFTTYFAAAASHQPTTSILLSVSLDKTCDNQLETSKATGPTLTTVTVPPKTEPNQSINQSIAQPTNQTHL